MSERARSGHAEPQPDDRRGHPRTQLTIPVHVRSGESVRDCISTNVSRSGVCCLMTEPIPLFTRVRVALCAPGSNAKTEAGAGMECDGIVVRQEEVETPQGDLFETAIFFQDPPQGIGEFLTSYVIPKSA